MGKSTIILGTVFGLLLALTVLFFVGGTLSAELTAATATGAEYPGAYASIAGIVADGTAFQRFSEPMPPDPAACRLEDVTLRLQNHGLLDAEWLSVKVDGGPGDIAVYSITGEGGAVPALGEAPVNLKIASTVRGTRERTYHIIYYVYGLKRQITVKQTGEAQS